MKLPSYSLVAQRIVFPVADRIRGIPIGRRLDELDESQWWSAQRLAALQQERLANLIRHVYENVPYYRRMMSERGLTPRDIREPADLPKLPVLTKEIIRREGEAMRAKNVPPHHQIRGTTGGSTGEPMQFWHDRLAQADGQAAFRRGLRWGGLEWGEPVVSVSGGLLGTGRLSLKQRLARKVTRYHFLPAFELRRTRAIELGRALERVEPRALIGYTSALVALGTVLEEQGVSIRVPLVFTTAEVLLSEHRETLERVFGAKVFDYYGCGEVNSIAYQCEQRDGYHLVDEKVLVETTQLTEGGAAATAGTVLLTDLSNFAFPFIRYENGDCVELQSSRCACGRELRRLSKIIGRVHDFIVTMSGDLLAGEFFPHLFKWVHDVRQFQIIQERLGALRVLIVPGPAFDEQFLTSKLREYLGTSMRIEVERVEQIPSTAAGKRRVTISRLDPTTLRGVIRGRSS